MLHKELWQQLIELDGQKTAERTKCQYLTDPERYVINLLSTQYTVNLSEREIFPNRDGSEAIPAEFHEQLCLLAYLINAKNVQLANKHVRGQSLPGGQFFFKGQHDLPTKRLEEALGVCPERLYQLVEPFRAKRCEFGDASIELYLLPRIPLMIVIWGCCDKFPARSSILFDQIH